MYIFNQFGELGPRRGIYTKFELQEDMDAFTTW
jgi:hypothetical protein